MGGHASHRVDLAAELRHEERVHHRRRRQAEVDRGSYRHDQLVDRGNTLIGVDEQPFPIERHNVHPKRVGVRRDRRPRIELMGADPIDPAQQDHNQRRDRPDDKLDTSFISRIPAVAGAWVGRPVPPSEPQGRQDHGNHDHEHDGRRVDQKEPLRRRDRPLRIHHSGGLTGSNHHRGACDQPAKRARALRPKPRIRWGSVRCVTPILHGGLRDRGVTPKTPLASRQILTTEF